MSLKKKILIFVVSIVFIFGLKNAVKADSTGCYYGSIKNPLYNNVNLESERRNVRAPRKKSGSEIDENLYSENKDEVAACFRDNAIRRTTLFSIYMKTKTDNELSNTIIEQYVTEIFNIATSERLAINSSSGDYLKWSWCELGYLANWSSLIENEKYINYIEFQFDMAYFTTYEQEQELDNDIQSYINSIDANMSDYEKIKTVYDYITTNVEYDYDNLYDDTYLLKHSAYAAFENKTAVCQGYATLLYKMMKEIGISKVRIITSETHAWNIVGIEDIYYCVDSTWDADFKKYELEYHYFLKGLNTFNNLREHTMAEEFFEEDFINNYPISAEDYILPNNDENNNSGDNNTGNETGNNGNGENQGNNDTNESTNTNTNDNMEENNNAETNTNTNTNSETNNNSYTDSDTNDNSNTNTNINTSNNTNVNTNMNNNVNTTNTQKINNTPVIYPTKIKGFKLKKNYTNKVTLQWNKQSYGTTYQIDLYNAKKKKYQCKKTLNEYTTSATIKELTDGTTYTFRIRAIKTINGKTIYGEYTYLNVTTKPKKVNISKLKSTTKKSINIFWKKISNSSGYEIHYSTKNSFKDSKSIKIKGKKTLSKTIRKLKSKKKYYIKIRAYKKVDGKKIYGDFSKTKNIKVK